MFTLIISATPVRPEEGHQPRVRVVRVGVGSSEQMEKGVKKSSSRVGKQMDQANATELSGSTNKTPGLEIMNLGVRFNTAFFSRYVQLQEYRHNSKQKTGSYEVWAFRR